MAKQGERRRFRDYPAYLAMEQNLTELNAKLVLAREAEDEAQEVLRLVQGPEQPWRGAQAPSVAVAALVVGENLDTSGAEVSRLQAQEDLAAARKVVATMSEAVQRQMQLMEHFRRHNHAEVMEGGWVAAIRAVLARELAAAIELSRAQEDYRALVHEAGQEGLSFSGSLGTLSPLIGSLKVEGSAIRSLLAEAEARGLALPKIPELAAGLAEQQAEDARREQLDAEARLRRQAEKDERARRAEARADALRGTVRLEVS